MRNKKLKMKLGQLQEEISKASLPVSADLCNNFKSIILETDQRKSKNRCTSYMWSNDMFVLWNRISATF